MKAMKKLVCALLALTCAFAFCACGEGHPMYKDFTFTQTEWEDGFGTGLQVEVKNVSGCTYQSVKVGYKAKSDINYDEIAKYIEKVVFDAKGREFTQEEAAEIAKTVNLYAGEAKFDVNTNDKVRKAEKVQLYFKGQYEGKDITFASKETTFPELVKYFEVANLTLTYKKDGENRSSYMLYNVEKDEYNVVEH